MRMTSTSLKASLSAALLIAAALPACTKSPSGSPREPTLGVRLSEAPAVRLEATQDGRHLVFITSPTAAGPDVPDGILLGTMAAVPAEGGAVRTLGTGVSTLEGSYQLSGSRLAFLAGFDLAKGAGTLWLADLDKPGEPPRQLAEGVTFHRFSPGSSFLAYVTDGALHLTDVSSGTDAVLDRGAATFEFSPDASKLLYRKPLTAGGGLFLVRLTPGKAPFSSAPVQLAERVGDYAFSPDGRFVALTSRVADAGAPYSTLILPSDAPNRQVLAGERAGSFLFSPDSAVLAFIANQPPGMPSGDLFLLPLNDGTFSGGDRPGTEPHLIGTSAADFRFSPSGNDLAVRQNYRNDKGQMWQEFQVVSVPEGKVRLHQKARPKTFISFEFSSDSRELAFIRHNAERLDLWRLSLAGEGEPEVVAPWTYEYHYVAPSGGTEGGLPLWYRGSCVREGRDCTLFAAPPLAAEPPRQDAAEPEQKDGGSDAAPKSEKAPAYPRHADLARGISGFTLSKSGTRLFLDTPCLDVTDAFDLFWQEASAAPGSARRHLVDRHVLKNSLVMLDAEGKRVAYVVTGAKRAGVYAANLEALPPAAK